MISFVFVNYYFDDISRRNFVTRRLVSWSRDWAWTWAWMAFPQREGGVNEDNCSTGGAIVDLFLTRPPIEQS